MEKLTLEQILDRLREIKFPKFDLIAAIGKGGIIPASLIQNILDVDMKILWLNFRDKDNKIIYEKPKLVKKKDFSVENKKILIVDDVSRTGKTLEEAKRFLKGNQIKTFVVNGKADYNIVNKKECVLMPWK